MYDVFACEYGYTRDEFLNLTLRQVIALRHKIEERKTRELYMQFAIQAAFKRVKIPPLSQFMKRSEPQTEFDKQLDLKLEKAAMDVVKRKQEEYERGRQRTTDKTQR